MPVGCRGRGETIWGMTRKGAAGRVARGPLPQGCLRARDEWLSCRSRLDGGGRVPRTLSEIVAHYIRYHRRAAQSEIDFYANLQTLNDALERAGRAERPDGKRHDHQRRIGRKAIRRAGLAIKSANLRRCASFEDLHQRLDDTLGSKRGIGELMVYDTALRIGAKLGVSPAVVYLHRGTRDGARALGLAGGRKYVDVRDLPAPFARLSPREIEDCLCIYKDRLRALGIRAKS